MNERQGILFHQNTVIRHPGLSIGVEGVIPASCSARIPPKFT